MESCREIELEGHIIDSGVMTLVFDRIMDMGGEFEILTFNVGKLKTDTSYARLRVTAPDDHLLDAILSELHRLGARTPPEIGDVTLVPAEGDRILPKGGFYSTTNHPTFVKYRDEWLPVERIEMDCHIVVDEKEKRAICTPPIAKIKAGDAVVVSETGVRVVYPPERPRKVSTFEFMHGTVSSERPSEAIIGKIAREILRSKRKGEKIALVGGPPPSFIPERPTLSQR